MKIINKSRKEYQRTESSLVLFFLGGERKKKKREGPLSVLSVRTGCSEKGKIREPISIVCWGTEQWIKLDVHVKWGGKRKGGETFKCLVAVAVLRKKRPYFPLAALGGRR